MRIAWIGPPPTMSGGVPQVATLLLTALADLGHRIDCFTVTGPEPPPPRAAEHPGIDLVTGHRAWRWNRWYSRGGASLLTVASEQLTRARTQHALLAELLERHEREPYDLVYQFSQWELLGLRAARHRLPPIVLHPQVHAAGELRWHRRERALSRVCEPRARTLAVRQMLRARSVLQRRDAGVVNHVIAASRPFADDLTADYGVEPARLSVVPNPVAVDLFTPPVSEVAGDGMQEVLYVSRFSVRKGLEMVVDLSHRLADLDGRVRIRLVGHTSLWSDYRPLLEGLNPSVAVVHGQADAEAMPALYRAADLLVQPSHYEPFGLTIAEALACGTPVVAADCVGSMAGLDPRCATPFPTGDADAFESAVRQALDVARGGSAAAVATVARSEAERCFAASVVGEELDAVLRTVLETGRPTS
jgi:glycosyltransferase involved in cell wall biosynthesis